MTLEELQTRKAAYLAAEIAVLQGQEYTIGDGVINRRLRRADLEQIRAEIQVIDEQITLLSSAAYGTRRIIYLR